MAKLGVPTTRALAAVTTGEQVAREQMLPGGVITRVANSFIRVGTFQFFAASGDVESIRKLANFVIARNYPEALAAANPYVAFYQAVVTGQAALIAQWMQIGFIHGVMNTDNMSIAGETIDYGPCAFMDDFDFNQVYSYIDRDGRYAYSNQPAIGFWNLTRLAESLLPLLAEDTDAAVEIAKYILNTFGESYEKHWLAGMRAKCGLTENVDKQSDEEDKALTELLLNIMAENKVDFTLTFYHLSQLSMQAADQDEQLRALFGKSEQLDEWLIAWRKRLATESASDAERFTQMQAVNPVYIPRNHQIEAAIRAAEDYNDFSVFHALHAVLQNPYQRQPGKESYQLPPKPEEVVAQTFCGT